jgi:1-acyl-sn-glycerol-3-phosphate acyltransferase
MFVRVEGRQNIQHKTSYVVISNHVSLYDIFLIYGWLGIDIKWVMKKELRKIPGVGFGSRKVGHIFLDRSNRRVAVESLNEAKRKLVSGTSVVLFPEGTRSVSGEMGTFKRGAFKLALDLGLPLLPLTLVGTKKIMPTGTLNILPGKVKMIIHEPIDIKKYTEDNLAELMLQAKEIIGSALPG